MGMSPKTFQDPEFALKPYLDKYAFSLKIFGPNEHRDPTYFRFRVFSGDDAVAVLRLVHNYRAGLSRIHVGYVSSGLAREELSKALNAFVEQYHIDIDEVDPKVIDHVLKGPREVPTVAICDSKLAEMFDVKRKKHLDNLVRAAIDGVYESDDEE
ncbi:MAG: hypothetical protein Q7R56_02215 [Nanoarchaeota archaeon]|nr:hypothetical protein [Nanoarchaeota archaeon]